MIDSSMNYNIPVLIRKKVYAIGTHGKRIGIGIDGDKEYWFIWSNGEIERYIPLSGFIDAISKGYFVDTAFIYYGMLPESYEQLKRIAGTGDKHFHYFLNRLLFAQAYYYQTKTCNQILTKASKSELSSFLHNRIKSLEEVVRMMGDPV